MPILYQGGEIQVQVYVAAEHDVANADVLIWATHQSLAAPDRGLPSSQFVRFPPRQLLSAIKRAIGNRDHQPLNGALTRLQPTAIRSTIRLAEPWRCRQISRINEWRQLISRSGRVEGMEFVLPESFCRSALDRPPCACTGRGLLRAFGGDRALALSSRTKHAERQPDRSHFRLRASPQEERECRTSPI
jgi:plasmid replication initiation protein